MLLRGAPEMCVCVCMFVLGLINRYLNCVRGVSLQLKWDFQTIALQREKCSRGSIVHT